MPRYSFLLQVRPGLLGEYRQRHAAVWPDMLRALRDSGWRNESFQLLDEVFNLDDQLGGGPS